MNGEITNAIIEATKKYAETLYTCCSASNKAK